MHKILNYTWVALMTCVIMAGWIYIGILALDAFDKEAEQREKVARSYTERMNK